MLLLGHDGYLLDLLELGQDAARKQLRQRHILLVRVDLFADALADLVPVAPLERLGGEAADERHVALEVVRERAQLLGCHGGARVGVAERLDELVAHGPPLRHVALDSLGVQVEDGRRRPALLLADKLGQREPELVEVLKGLLDGAQHAVLRRREAEAALALVEVARLLKGGAQLAVDVVRALHDAQQVLLVVLHVLEVVDLDLEVLAVALKGELLLLESRDHARLVVVKRVERFADGPRQLRGPLAKLPEELELGVGRGEARREAHALAARVHDACVLLEHARRALALLDKSLDGQQLRLVLGAVADALDHVEVEAVHSVSLGL